MRILFLSLSEFDSYGEAGIYTDLMRCAIRKGHKVFTVVPNTESDDRYRLIEEGDNRILKVKTGRTTGNSNFISKGLNLLRTGVTYKKGIKKFCKGKFDIIVYATPPITVYGAIKYAKNKFSAKTYLLLKDIFPQNALDIGILSPHGIGGIIVRYFRRIEKKYYAVSDKIGCMSERNREYFLEKNPEISAEKVCINPNSVDLERISRLEVNREEIRKEYNIPSDAKAFIYGGNLGKPQDVGFIVECLKKVKDRNDMFFVVCGRGSDYPLLKKFADEYRPSNLLLINGLSKEKYDRLSASCDIGLIFLDYRFTIPNYPSRILSYIQSGLSVLVCADRSTDIGDNVVEGGFGWKCYSNDVDGFVATAESAIKADLKEMQSKASGYLKENFSAEKGMDMIIKFAEEGE